MKYQVSFSPAENQRMTELIGMMLDDAHLTADKYLKLVKKFPLDSGKLPRKDQIIKRIRADIKSGQLPQRANQVIDAISLKPTRTNSGVTPVTVLTKPFPCPGKCIFCPNDIRMPKSYLKDEPGAQRAERNQFDPYLQTYNRLLAFQNTGHSTDKVELIILGGTWSFYPEEYQLWFVTRCYQALNDFGNGIDNREKYQQQINENLKKKTDANVKNIKDIDGENLAKTYNQVISELYTTPEKLMGLAAYQTATWDDLQSQQRLNETANCRNVGLVVETRPDYISEQEVIRIRKLGCTKTQIGIQSLQDDVLEKNKRGHDVAATRRAFRLLRQAGFKIHAHWMPNLYGSSVEKDKADFDQLFSDPDFCPDELKIYPCSLISSAELMQYYQDGRWQPYTQAELLEVLVHCLSRAPEYCRLTRVIRDIPSTDIVDGNKLTNFREIVEAELKARKIQLKEIRSREIKHQKLDKNSLQLMKVVYQTSVSPEMFLQYVTKDQQIAGFLRLSLPTQPNYISELGNAAMIREVHVYGRVTDLGAKPIADGNKADRAQHLGLGKKLITEAVKIASQAGYEKLAVISAIGTREYYRKQGFEDGELYQFKKV